MSNDIIKLYERLQQVGRFPTTIRALELSFKKVFQILNATAFISKRNLYTTSFSVLDIIVLNYLLDEHIIIERIIDLPGNPVYFKTYKLMWLNYLLANDLF